VAETTLVDADAPTGSLAIILKYKGELLALGAAILVSGYMVGSKVARRTLGGLETIFWLTVVEIAVAGVLVVLFGESFMPEELSGFAVPLFLAIAVQVAGQGFIITGLGHTPASIAGVLVVVQPVVAAAISWQLFDEPLAPLQGAGAVLILVAIIVSQRGKTAPKSDTASNPSQEPLKAFID
jgi:drug/metabolite transporter (DMT)-like permease